MRLQAQADPNLATGSESLGHAQTLSIRHPAIQECMEARVCLQKVRQHNGGLLLVRLKFTHNGPPGLSDFVSRFYRLYFTFFVLPQVYKRLGGGLGKLCFQHRQRDAPEG